MADQYVCNVQTWGAIPQYNQGDLVPDDCPYDLRAAALRRKIVTVAEYKRLHPGWDPGADARLAAAAAAATNGDGPDPDAEAEPQPVQVQATAPSPRSTRSIS